MTKEEMAVRDSYVELLIARAVAQLIDEGIFQGYSERNLNQRSSGVLLKYLMAASPERDELGFVRYFSQMHRDEIRSFRNAGQATQVVLQRARSLAPYFLDELVRYDRMAKALAELEQTEEDAE